MKSEKRIGRVAEQIREIMSDVILNRMKDPRLGFITITRVQVTDNLRHAKVYFSVYGGQKDKQGTKAAFAHSERFLQRALNNRLKIRTIPKLSFVFDPSVEHAFELEKIIKKIHDENSVEEK
ncbi:MAG: 30S ribosome-binding factor RbfA [Candidatus Omnitrophica bacterium]|nr:30S ribosome-binding factor RbfA [Candidatus Omnitrophota bacterium]